MELAVATARWLSAPARFLAPKVAATTVRAGKALRPTALGRFLMPRTGWRERLSTIRTDLGEHGFGHVIHVDADNGKRVPGWGVDEYLGRHAEHVQEDIDWQDVPHAFWGRPPSLDEPTPTDAGVERRMTSWWPPHRQRAAAVNALVDLELERWRTPEPDPEPGSAPEPVLNGEPAHATPPPRQEPRSVPTRRLPPLTLDPIPPGSAGVLTLHPRRSRKGPAMTQSVSLSSLEELLNPDWSQKDFQEDVPDWLDKVHAVLERIAVAFEELAELGVTVELPQSIRQGLQNLADMLAEAPVHAQQIAQQCRALYESYEIPNLG